MDCHYLLKDRAQQDIRPPVEVYLRPSGCGECGQCRADRAGVEAGGKTPNPHRHAPLEDLQRAQEPGPRTPDWVSQIPHRSTCVLIRPSYPSINCFLNSFLIQCCYLGNKEYKSSVVLKVIWLLQNQISDFVTLVHNTLFVPLPPLVRQTDCWQGFGPGLRHISALITHQDSHQQLHKINKQGLQKKGTRTIIVTCRIISTLLAVATFTSVLKVEAPEQYCTNRFQTVLDSLG